MAKTNGKYKLISLIVVLGVLFAGIVTTWAVYGENIEHNKEDIKTNTKALAVINDPKDGPIVDIAIMKKDIEQIKTDQTVGFREILRRLPK